MGVVKNLMVRIGADVRGVVGGMKTAYSATRQATSQIKNATAGMKKSVKDSFSGSRMSIREYTETMSKLKASHNAAAQNTQRLQEKLDQMKSVYDSLKTATDGLDLSTPLTTQIRDAEESWHGFLNEAQKIKEVLRKELGSENSSDNGEKINSLRQQLQSLREKASEAELELRNLRAVASTIGSENLQFASIPGMEKLQSDMQRVQRELDVSKIKAGELGQKLHAMSIPQLIKSELKSIGAAAASAARAGLSQLGSKLRDLGGAAARGLFSLPAKLLGIGRTADSSNNSLDRMVRSIRNIGIVALGLRVFRGIFGELQGIVSNYISQNQALSATITTLKNQLGQALAPAINLIAAALQQLMPVIMTVASAINAIFSALFGKTIAVTSAVATGVSSAASSAASSATSAIEDVKETTEELDLYGFDQITKVSDNSEDNSNSGNTGDGGGLGGGLGSLFDLGEPPEWVKQVTEWIEKMKEAFRAGDWEGLGRIFGEGVNAAVDAINAVDIGTKIGTFANNVFRTLHSALATIDFYDIGKKVGELVTAGVEAINWKTVGETIGMAITALPSVLIGFIQNTKWDVIAQSLSTMLGSALTTVGSWIQSQDWLRIGEAIWTFVSNINYGEIASGLFSFLGSALSASVSLVFGYIGSAVESIKAYFTEKIQECGGSVAQGLLKGIWDGLVGLGTWINENIVTPFLEAFKSAFGIHSPSTVMEEQGGFLISGLLNGITNAWTTITEFFGGALESLKETLGAGWEKIKEGTSEAWTTVSETVSNAWTNIKTWVSDAGSRVQTSVSTAWANIKAAVTGELGETQNNNAMAWGSIESTALTAGKSIDASAASVWTNIGQTIDTKLASANTSVSTELSTMLSTVTMALSSLDTQFTQSWSKIQMDTNNAIATITQNMRISFDQIRASTTEAFTQMRTTIAQTWQSAVATLTANNATLVAQFKQTWAMLESATQSSWRSMTSTVISLVNTMRTTLTNTMTALQQKLTSIWTSIRTASTSAANTCSSAVQSAFRTMSNNAVTSWSTMHTNIVRLAGSIVETVSSMANSVIDSAVNMANAIASAVASSIANMNTLASLESGSSGGSSSGVTGTGPTVTLATGGITTGPTYALIGEAGKEAVLPLENNTGWMDALALRLAAAGAGGGNGASVTIPIYLGSRKLTQYIIKDINNITKETGVSPIYV